MAREKVEVVAYSGYRGEEIPRVFKWWGTKIEVAEIRSRSIEQGAGDRNDRNTRRLFRLEGTDGKAYSLIYDEQTQEWSCEGA